MRGKYVGYNYQSGTKKDGTSYAFYNFFFQVPTPDTGLGLNFECLSGQSDKFPCLLKKDNIGKSCLFTKYKNYLNDVEIQE